MVPLLSCNVSHLIVVVTKVSPCPKPPKGNAWCPACLCRNIVTRTMRLRLSTPAPITWPTDAAQSWATPTWTAIHTPQQSLYAQMHHYTTLWCRKVHIAAMYFHVWPTNQQEHSVFWLVEWLSSCMQRKVLTTTLILLFNCEIVWLVSGHEVTGGTLILWDLNYHDKLWIGYLAAWHRNLRIPWVARWEGDGVS